VVNAPRRTLLLAGAAVPLGWLGACAALDEAALSDGEAARQAAEARRGPGGPGLLTPWQVIRGGWRRDAGTLPAPGSPAPPVAGAGLAGTGARLNLLLPIGVAARDDVVLIVDGGLRSVLRGLRTQDSLTPWLAHPGPTSGLGASLALTADLGVYLALPQLGEVQEFDVRGRQVRRLRDEQRAAQPLAVAVGEDRSRLFVADGQSGRVAVFAPSGGVIEVWGSGGATASLQSAVALAVGPDGLHVVDRAAQQVVVFDGNGRVAAAYGEGSLARPRAVAVDHHGRAFVCDEADQAISVFWRGERVARYPEAGRPAPFRSIEALAIDGNQLYVADAAGARVHVLLIAPPSLSSGPAPDPVPPSALAPSGS
jgi:hypothetical protein